MGCCDSKYTNISIQPSEFAHCFDLNSKSYEDQPLHDCKRQNFHVSDYQAFILDSKKDNKTYPTSFSYIKHELLSNQQISCIPKQQIPPLNCSRYQLILLSSDIIRTTEYGRNFLSKRNLVGLISQIADSYNSVAYHNFSHGFSLMQMIFKCFSLSLTLSSCYSEQDLTFYLIAGISHDINHKGTNNQYEVKLQSNLAILAENESVLEKMHLYTLFTIFKSKSQFDILSKVENPTKSKQKITRAILATDMSKHYFNLQKMKKIISQQLTGTNEEPKMILMENLFHGCDIGNSLLPKQEYFTWGALLTYQFHEQTQREKQNNVTVSDCLIYKGMKSFYKDQMFFVNEFVLPLWKSICSVIGGIQQMIEVGQENIKTIEKLWKDQQC